MNYVLGLAFYMRTYLVVIRRSDTCPIPELRGKWNGIGGKIERDEGSLEAMVREFEEETSVKTAWSEWTEFAVMHTAPPIGSYVPTPEIHCFSTELSSEQFAKIRTPTKEVVDYIQIRQEPNLAPHMRTLIEIAMDDFTNIVHLNVKERG